MLPTRLIVATDFSTNAAPGLAIAKRLAKVLGARLTLAHVYDPEPLGIAVHYPVRVWTGVDDGAAQRARLEKLIAAERAKYFDDSAEVEVCVLEHANAALGLCELATKTGAGLVIMGTHGRTGVGRLLLGSVAERTIRQAPCGVLTVPPLTDATTFGSRLLVATDFSEAAESAVIMAGSLATALKSKVTLLHVYEQPAAPWADGHRELAEVDGALRESLRQRYQEHFESPPELSLLMAPNPALAIADCAAMTKADLVVMATRGRGGLSRLLLGSVAEATTRHAKCPVWTERSITKP